MNPEPRSEYCLIAETRLRAAPIKIARKHQIGVSLCLGAAHTSAKLVEIGEAKEVGPVNNHRVGIGNIQAAFDDRGRDEHIRITRHEGPHDQFEFVFAHLTMPDRDPRALDRAADALGDALDGLHAIVQEINLAAPSEFALDGVAKYSFIIGADEGFNRLAVGRRRFDKGHVARAH